jgi:CRP-like cAMP-binding protein
MAGIYAAGAVALGTTFAALSVGGFLFGISIAIGVILFGTLIAVSDRGGLPMKVKAPGRDEAIAMTAGAGLLAVSIAVVLLTDASAWIAIPIGGGAAIYLIYAYGRPSTAAPPAQAAGARTMAAAGQRAGLVETLGTVDIFKGLPDSALGQIAELGEVASIPEGHLMGAEGAVGQSVYVVLAGRAHLSADSSAGRLTARIAGPGESFPLAALLGEGRLITTVRASTDMKVWQVDRRVLKAYFRTHCETGAHVYARAATILAERYRSTIWRLTQTTADIVKSEGFWANV